LHRDVDGEHIKTEWEYDQPNLLEKSTRPDISYAVNQCARFISNPEASHMQAVMSRGR